MQTNLPPWSQNLQVNIDALKIWLHKNIDSTNKLLLCLACLNKPASLDDIRKISIQAGFKIPASWNMSSLLSRTKGKAIRTPKGWELTPSGFQSLDECGVSVNAGTPKISSGLRTHLEKIKNNETRTFVEEAILCYEYGLFRSAIVMSWISALDGLYNYILENRLTEFNAEARRIDTKWKTAQNRDDLTRMKEADFLDRISSISIIGKNVKEELQNCLKLRNGCGHPNSLKVGQHKTSSHIETLLQNVFEKFS